jgi:hypothetical protein
MKSLDDLTAEDLANLKPGDQVETVAERSPEFRVIAIDNCVVLPAPPWYFTVSLTRINSRKIKTIATVVPSVEGSLNLNPVGTQAQAGLMEEVQLRLTPDAVGDIALNLLAALAGIHPAIFKQKIDANPFIKQALLADAGA